MWHRLQIVNDALRSLESRNGLQKMVPGIDGVICFHVHRWNHIAASCHSVPSLFLCTFLSYSFFFSFSFSLLAYLLLFLSKEAYFFLFYYIRILVAFTFFLKLTFFFLPLLLLPSLLFLFRPPDFSFLFFV